MGVIGSTPQSAFPYYGTQSKLISLSYLRQLQIPVIGINIFEIHLVESELKCVLEIRNRDGTTKPDTRQYPPKADIEIEKNRK